MTDQHLGEHEEPDEDWRERMEGQLERLALSGTNLRESVDALRHPMDVLLELKKARLDFERSAATAAAEAREVEAQAAAARVADDRQVAVRQARSRRTLLIAAAVALAILLLATSLMSVALIRYVHTFVAEQRAAAARVTAAEEVTRYRNCLIRNDSVRSQIRREKILAGIPGENAIARKVHTDSAADLDKYLVDCGVYNAKKGTP